MASSITSAAVATRRRFAPRFSLAASLVAMTLCATGLWYWYRVPFEVVHSLYPPGTRRSPNQAAAEPAKMQETETLRRTWGGTIRHGPRRIEFDGRLLSLENYSEGVS